MNILDLKTHTHRRYNTLTGDWILVSPQRSKRPWLGHVEPVVSEKRSVYEPECSLCPGNKRSGGIVNDVYHKPYAFTNDFSALASDSPEADVNENGLLQATGQKGICRVICFSPDHSLTIPIMAHSALKDLIDLWLEEYTALSAHKWIRYIQIFENKGAMMGCSNPHPHGQIWAESLVPLELEKETYQQKKYFESKGRTLLGDYLEIELEKKERIVCFNDDFYVLVPFWATWPFETIIIPKRRVRQITDFTKTECSSLADIFKRLTTRYDNLFKTSFPYSSGMHQMPVNDGEDHPEWDWHMHFYPPLLRSASVKKFMVGYELLANPQRDVTPEYAAEQLRAMSEIHYLNQ